MTTKIFSRFLVVFFISFLITSTLSPHVSALNQTDFDAIYKGSTFYEDTVVCTPNTNTDVNTVGGVRDKIAQLLFVRVNDTAEATTAVGTHHVGGLYVSNEWFESTGQTSATAKQNMDSAIKGYNIAPFVGIDEEGGQVHRLQKMHGDMPSALEQGKMTNEELTELGNLWGQRMKAVGVTTDFAPVLDIHNPDNPIIGALERGYSSNPGVVAEKAEAFADGLRQAGITPTFKHFPGHGNASGDSHLGRVETPPLATMKTSDLVPYETMLDNPDSMVMMGHLDVPGLTDGGEPASLNKAALDLLRNDYGYNGIVITDDISGMVAIAGRIELPQAVEKAILVGNDIALFNGIGNVKQVIDYMETQSKANPELLQRIEDSSAKILAFKGNDIAYSPGTSAAADCTCEDGSSSTLVGGDNVEIAYNFLISKGLEPIHAAGIVGNLMRESSPELSPTLYNTQGSGAYGIAQWLGGRLDGLRNFAQENGYNPDTIEGQLEFLWWEISSPDSAEFQTHHVLEAIQATNDLEEIVLLWEKLFERAKDSAEGNQKRLNFATSVLAEFGSNGTQPTSSGTSCTTDDAGRVVNGYSLPLDQSWYDDNPELFTKPHHDYPAADIPIPTGTPVYSMTDGVIRKSGGGCGIGVTVAGDDGHSYNYCHGSDGGSVEGAKPGDRVSAGQLIMHSASTGNSSGPHLHLAIFVGGAKVCPQTLFVGIVEGNVPTVADLPRSGCSYRS